ncbi:MAG: heavy-metal-associated domain-containing protein [Actinomycetota bacterium]
MPKVTAILTSPAISCMHCAMTITGGLKTIEGIEDVVVDPQSKKVTVSYDSDKINENGIRAKLSELGYPAD